MRRRKATVELFEQLRREYEFGVGTVAGVARRYGVHRRLVREALSGAVPRQRLASARPRPRIGPVAGFIDAILEADRQAPRKQRHTAHRVYARIRQELPDCPIAESTVRRYVHQRKAALGQLRRDTYVPQSYAWGDEGQVDWYEAEAELDGQRLTLQVFSLRSMASGAAFHRAYLRATQQAFLEAHEQAFAYFGGVFRRLRYDNLGLAVKKILRGYQRQETERFVAFRSHWQFAAEFCTPTEAHEKGGIEGEVGRFRRNHWVPVPRAHDLEDLNRRLLAACGADEARTVDGRVQTVGAALLHERTALLPLAAEPFDLTERSQGLVSSLGWVRVKTNAYSVPLPAGSRVDIALRAATVELWQAGRLVVQHERCYGRHQEILNLEHYLDVLERKPGALAGSTPLEQWRRAGRWPDSYDQFWQQLVERQGRQAGTKAMIELLQLGRRHGAEALRRAIEQALELGCRDAAAVRHLVATTTLAHAPVERMAVGALARYDRPQPEVRAYDRLLALAGGPR